MAEAEDYESSYDSYGEYEGVDDDSTDPLGYSKRRRLSDTERLVRCRERNRVHARNTRERKKAQMDTLHQRVQVLIEERKRLKEKVADKNIASILMSLAGFTSPAEDSSAISSHTALKTYPLTIEQLQQQVAQDLSDHEEVDIENELMKKHKLTCSPHEMEALRSTLRRERNRLHAKRTRLRKKKLIQVLETMVRQLEEEVSALRQEFKLLSSSTECTSSEGSTVSSDSLSEHGIGNSRSKRSLLSLKMNPITSSHMHPTSTPTLHTECSKGTLKSKYLDAIQQRTGFQSEMSPLFPASTLQSVRVDHPQRSKYSAVVADLLELKSSNISIPPVDGFSGLKNNFADSSRTPLTKSPDLLQIEVPAENDSDPGQNLSEDSQLRVPDFSNAYSKPTGIKLDLKGVHSDNKVDSKSPYQESVAPNVKLSHRIPSMCEIEEASPTNMDRVSKSLLLYLPDTQV